MPRGTIAPDGTVTITYNPSNGDPLVVGGKHVLPCTCCGQLNGEVFDLAPNVVSFVCSACARARDHGDEDRLAGVVPQVRRREHRRLPAARYRRGRESQVRGVRLEPRLRPRPRERELVRAPRAPLGRRVVGNGVGHEANDD